ncbi:hypothetical protein EKK58_00085 [Candidatus Dependentiae bacterium]|nr:MAG: hypothetical protein EKK58_00085 [Candidatus Dependentiae bacterium]
MSTTAKQLLADINAAISGRRALKTFIKEMGYVISPRCVLVSLHRQDGEGKDHFVVHELLDEDNHEREVSFSFLYDRASENGVILPFPFSKYESLAKKKKKSKAPS